MFRSYNLKGNGMIVMIEGRNGIRAGFAALFEREGVPLDGVAPDELSAWLAALSREDARELDLVLLGEGGASAEGLRIVREHTSAPVIALNDGRGVAGTLELFDLGVDDVVRVPVHAREVLARAAAIRCRRRAEADPTLRFGLLNVYRDGRDPEVAGTPLPLPRRERRVLEVLARAHGRYVSKTQLYSAVYGLLRTDVEESVIESHVSKLRRKLRRAMDCDPITSTRFLGYRLDAPVAGGGEPRARIAA